MKEIARELLKVARLLVANVDRFVVQNKNEFEEAAENWAEEKAKEFQNNAILDVYDVEYESESVESGPYSIGSYQRAVDFQWRVKNVPNMSMGQILAEVISSMGDDYLELDFDGFVGDQESNREVGKFYRKTMSKELLRSRALMKIVLDAMKAFFTDLEIGVDGPGVSLVEVKMDLEFRANKWNWKLSRSSQEKIFKELDDSEVTWTGTVPGSMRND